MSLILDCNIVAAAATPQDRDHVACKRLLLESHEQRVVPSPILVEVDYLLQSGPTWMALLRDIARGSLRVADLEPIDYERIHELMTTYADLRVGFVDCAVLAVVERLGEPKLATLDRRHFSVMRPAHIDSLRLLP